MLYIYIYIYIWLLFNIYRLIALRIACVLLRSFVWVNECFYLLQNDSPWQQHCGNYFPENYQFTLSGPWQVSAVAVAFWLFSGVINWLEHFLHWWVQVTFLSSYVGSFSTIVRRGYDLILMFSRVCLKVLMGPFAMGFLPSYWCPLTMFRMSVIIMLFKHVDDLCPDSSYSFIRRYSLSCLAFHERGILVLLWCLGSFLLLLSALPLPSDLCSHFAFVSREASSMTIFLSLALCWEHWAVACYPSRGARSFTPSDGYWGLL